MARRKRGYTLLEMLIVLAVMALAIAIVVPRGEAMLDQMTAHAVFFDFQRQVSDLRRGAYASQTGVMIRGSDDTDPAWRAPGPSRCAPAGATASPSRSPSAKAAPAPAATWRFLKYRRPVMHLAMADRACHFVRLD